MVKLSHAHHRTKRGVSKRNPFGVGKGRGFCVVCNSEFRVNTAFGKPSKNYKLWIDYIRKVRATGRGRELCWYHWKCGRGFKLACEEVHSRTCDNDRLASDIHKALDNPDTRRLLGGW